MLDKAPSGPHIRKQAHLQRLAATTWAHHRHKPEVAILTRYVHRLSVQAVRQFLNGHRLQWALAARAEPVTDLSPNPSKQLHAVTCYSLKAGMSSVGVTSPLPTCRDKDGHGSPSPA